MTIATRSRSRSGGTDHHLREDMHRVRADLGVLAGTTGRRAREAMEAAREGMIDRLNRYSGSIGDHPWRSIAMAFAAGMLVAAWMRR